jgi:MFS transporter, PPP family, 3-phenylpropionic acid transporter
MTSAIFYFLYFCAFGIYVPYWTLYLQDLKFSPVQIATVYSILSIARIFILALHGYLADRWKSRKKFLIVCSVLQIIPLVLITWLHSYSWILLLISVYSILNAGILPFADATVQEEQEKGNLDYGRTRLWGTLGFILVALIYGEILNDAPTSWILYGIIAFFVLLSIISFFIPAGKTHFSLPEKILYTVFNNRNVWLVLICAFLMQMSHGTFYGFYSIHLASLGYKDSWIGLQWAIAAGSELSILFFASWILRNFPSHLLYSICLFAAAIRWFLTGSTTSFGALSAIQCLHAFSFGAFHIASMRLIHTLFPEGSRSFGQALYTSAGTGLGTMIGILASGFLWNSMGNRSFFISGFVALFAFGLSMFMRGDTKNH